MKQALNIFRKDVRHLWPTILVVLLLAAAQAYYDVLRSPINGVETARTNTIAVLLKAIEVLAWFYLIASIIFEEPLPGDRHFWLTRPYSRWSLLAAKLLFILAFFNGTLLLSDCCLLWEAQLRIALPALLLRQIFLTSVIALPVLTLATLTRGISQLVLAALLLLVAFVGELILLSPPATAGRGVVISGVSSSFEAVALGCLAIAAIVWQFATRRTSVAVVVLAICIFGVLPAADALIPAGRINEFEDYSPEVKQEFDPGKLDIAISKEPFANCYATGQGGGWIRLAFPVDVPPLPPGVLLLGRSEIHIDTVRSRPGERVYGFLSRVNHQYCLDVSIRRTDIDLKPSSGASLRADLWLTLERDEPIVRAPMAQAIFRLPGSGYCSARFTSADPNVTLVCTTGPYGFNNLIVRLGAQLPDRNSLWELELPGRHEVEHGLSPVQKNAFQFSAGTPAGNFVPPPSPLHDPGTQIAFYQRRPIGYGRKRIEAAGLDLRAFVSK